MFTPPKWGYEPIGIARQRRLSEFERLRDDISPLVAKGDGLSILRARQIARQARRDTPDQKAASKNRLVGRIRDAVREASKQMQVEGAGLVGAPPEVQMAADREAAGIPPQKGGSKPFFGGVGSVLRKTQHVVQDIPASTLGIKSEGPPPTALGQAKERLGTIFSGEQTANQLASIPELGIHNAPGTAVRRQIERVPRIGGQLGQAADIATAPATLLTAGLEPAAPLLPGIAGRIASGIATVPGKTFPQRLGFQVGASLGGGIGAEQVARHIPENAPGVVKVGAPIAGGLAGGIIGGGLGSAATGNTSLQRIGQRALEAAPESAAVPAVAGGTSPLIPSAVRAETGSALEAAARQAGANIGGGAARTGNRLLQLPDTEQIAAELGRAPELKDIFNIDRMGRREVTAQANRLRAQATLDFRALGKTTKDAKGNVLVRGIAPDAADTARGQEWAPLVKVLEKPGNYDLTPQQIEAVQRLATIPELVKAERAAFGVAPRLLTVEEGEQFIWRKAKATSKGVKTDKASPSAGGMRFGGGGDKSRIIADIDEALDRGVVYAHPQEAFDQNVMRGLKKAVDEHVKGLFVPMSDSAAARVSPGLRAKHDYLTQRLTSLKGTLGRLDARNRAAIDAYINAAEPDMDALYDELVQVRSRSGKLAPDVAKQLDDTMAEIRKLRPAWRREVRLSKNIPAGRSGVPMDVAPALSGRDFAPDVAQRIEDYYRHTARIRIPRTDRSLSLKADIPVARAISSAITPVRATGDMSAIFINQATTAARHPVTFGRNVAAGFRDLVADRPYQTWLASGETDDGARHGLAIVGDVGERVEFQFNNWMQRVPVLRQLNDHYVRFNNRMRVDLYNLEVRARGGERNLDDATKEGIARAINRFTGVSNARATDLEALTEFAPNFTRAHIETIASALSDGTIEGTLARQYLATMLAAGSSMVAGLALAQGRDPGEVMSPFSLDELKDGKLRLNPNFMSYRAFGQDVKVFGKYDSLMRLAAVAFDAGLRSVGEQDAMQLFDAIGYASGSMGSPAATFLTSLIKGETFEGDAPLSPRGLVSNVTPFTSDELVSGLRSAGANALRGDFGAAGSDLAATVTTFAGGKASPLTPTEQLDQVAQARYGSAFFDLEPYQRREIEQTNPDLAGARLDRASEQSQEAAATRKQYVERQQALDDQLLSGQMKREEYVDEYHRLQTERGALLDRIYGDEPITDPKTPTQKYAMFIQQSKDPATGRLDFDKLDGKMETLNVDERAYLERNIGLDDTAVTRQFRAMRKLRKERNALPKYRGYDADQANQIDEVWQEVRNLAPSAEELPMRRALRQYAAANQIDPEIYRGVHRRISGRMRQLNVRKRFDMQHPEMEVFYGRGRLTAAEAEMLSAQRDAA